MRKAWVQRLVLHLLSVSIYSDLHLISSLHRIKVELVITSGLSWIDLFCRFYTGRRPAIMIADLEMLKLVLVKEFDSFTDRPVTLPKYFLTGMGCPLKHRPLFLSLPSSLSSLPHAAVSRHPPQETQLRPGDSVLARGDLETLSTDDFADFLHLEDEDGERGIGSRVSEGW